MNLRIGVDATCWANGRGYGRFARELLGAMIALAPQHEFICFGDAKALEAGPCGGTNRRDVAVRQGSAAVHAASADGYRSLSDMLRLSLAVYREKPDVFFSPSVYTYFPLPLGQRAVVTVHDAIAERFPELTVPGARARLFWTLKVAAALKQARLVLTVSEYAANEIAEVHRLNRNRIRVALEAPAKAYFPAPCGEIELARARIGLTQGARYFSYVGGFSPHKRVDNILRAHARVVAAEADPPYLVLVGRLEGDAFLSTGGQLRSLSQSLGTDQFVRWTGFLPDDVVRAVHSGAVASLLPSESEGFGLPAVESAACGTPPIATTASPLPQLLQGGGYFVPPGDVDAIAAGMSLLLNDPALRAELSAVARKRAALLSWEAGARSALAALEEAAA